MDSSLIGKVDKAKKYAQERERVRFSHFTLRFQGNHRVHELTYRSGSWNCTCGYFPRHETCSHVMAVERMLEGMLESRPAPLGAS